MSGNLITLGLGAAKKFLVTLGLLPDVFSGRLGKMEVVAAQAFSESLYASGSHSHDIIGEPFSFSPTTANLASTATQGTST